MPACARCGAPNANDAAFCGRCGSRIRPAPASASARKVVTILFSDVTGFTALGERLDPESLQQLMSRWFGETRRIIEHHDGTVEKYMGDAVMAVFGVPVVHEDDAVRAARAALEMHETLNGLNDELEGRWGVRLEIHTGLNTGEVVVGSEPGGDLSTVGDAVNSAQRLESAAPPGGVLIGSETARHLGGIAQTDAVDALTLKGKSLPVKAWRLRSVRSERAPGPSGPTPPFVGRRADLERIRSTYHEAVRSCEPRMITVLGPAGIGKSRLVRAFVDEVRPGATTAVGRCLPYGDGITYWPLAEIVRSLAGAPTEAAVAALIGGAQGSAQPVLIARHVCRATGFASGTVSGEDAKWAMRTLLEEMAAQRPLVVVVEDIHWAEPVLLNLLTHVATSAAHVPLLVVCLARPELLDEQPSWVSGAGDRSSITTLEPLLPRQAEELIDRLAARTDLPPEERSRYLSAAEGNPFFLQQMVAMRAEAGAEARAIPPTIQAVLTSRIDRLPVAERAALAAAAIEGRTFHGAAVAGLVPEPHRQKLEGAMESLLRRGLIRPAQPEFAAELAYRFDHILIRDATYSLIPKQARAELHERHAGWLERRSDYELGKHEEVAGYHLEQAHGYRLELEPGASGRHRPLATRAARHLGAAGEAALARDDIPAAIKLLSRAVDLLPEDAPELGNLMPELGAALTESGRLAEAQSLLEMATARAPARGDRIAEAHALIALLFARLQVDTGAAAREVRDRFDELRLTFEGVGDDLGMGRLWRLRALVHWIEARTASAERAWERAAEHARQAGDERGWSDSLSWLASAAHAGPMHVDAAIERCEGIRSQLGNHRRAQALVLDHLAAIRAMRGEFADARRLVADSRAIMEELGMSVHTAICHGEAFVLVASGDGEGAEARLRAGYQRLSDMGEKALLSDTVALLAHVLCEQGRTDEAWELSHEAEEAAAEDDLSAQIVWRTARARLLARRAEIVEAKRLSADAVELAARTDWLSDHADALVAHAEVLLLAGDGDEAVVAVGKAIALYDRKGNRVGAGRARSLLATRLPV
jgi:class 3 adenylate cyclase/tetratricopeptide (TPR) repeat protein